MAHSISQCFHASIYSHAITNNTTIESLACSDFATHDIERCTVCNSFH